MKKRLLFLSVLGALALASCQTNQGDNTSSAEPPAESTSQQTSESTAAQTSETSAAPATTSEAPQTQTSDTSAPAPAQTSSSGADPQGDDSSAAPSGDTSSQTTPVGYFDMKIKERLFHWIDQANRKYDYIWGEEEKLSDALAGEEVSGANYYGGTFTNRLAEPNETVNNFNELVYAIEYANFYHLPSITVKFGTGYTYETAQKEFNKAFYASRLTPHVSSFKTNATNDTYTVTFLYNEYAATRYKNYAAEQYFGMPTIYQIEQNPTAKITNLSYTPTNGQLDVYNSDQLLFALYNGYEPVAAPGSVAAILLATAEGILTDIIHVGMTDIQKIYAVNDYLISSCVYDSFGDDLACAYFADEAEYPGKLSSLFCSFYAEGPLLYHQGACAGFAKAASLLLSLIGVNHQRVTGGHADLDATINNKSLEDGYWYHEYNYYITDGGKYYVCDPTYSYGGYDIEFNGVNYSFPIRKDAVALTREEWGTIYADLNDIVSQFEPAKLGTEELNFANQIYIDSTHTICVKNVTEFEEAYNAARTALSAYKAANSITEPRLYRLSFFMDYGYEENTGYIFDSIRDKFNVGQLYDFYMTGNPTYAHLYNYNIALVA